ncbi:hypothetical protein EAH_00067750, partial [Eimeria acervulina]
CGLQRARERPLSASRRLASLVDVSLELEEYYREMRESKKQTKKAAETLKKKNSKKKQKENKSLSHILSRDPVWWMCSTASLKVRIPPNHVIQSQFNLASVSSFDVKAYTMHDLLDWDFHVLSLPEPEAVRLCRDLLVYYAERAALGIRGEIIMNFCGALHANYLPNPYHNFYHALNVVQGLWFCSVSSFDEGVASNVLGFKRM